MPLKPESRRVVRRERSVSSKLIRRAKQSKYVVLFILGVIIIFSWILLQITFARNFNSSYEPLWSHDSRYSNKSLGTSVGGTHLRGGGRKNRVWVHADSQQFNEESAATKATHLIIVAGHSVLVSGDVEHAADDESVWWLLDYQRNQGLPQAIVSHIQAGIKIALEDENSLLIFSGGETRAQIGPETEGGSYFRVADALDLWDGYDVFREDDGKNAGSMKRQSTVRARTTTEEYATDSFQNLSYSICRFREITGSFPKQISMVSFSFKQTRFETLHAAALRWPLDQFHYIGVDPPSSTGFNLKKSSEGEKINSLQPFQTDPYGCHTEILERKRIERNPFTRTAPYELTCPEMKDLLHWCGPDFISKSKVPWVGL